MQEGNRVQDAADIGLKDIVDFVKESYKLVVGLGLMGILVAAGGLSMVNPQYEATALIEMAQVRPVRNPTMAASVEAPAMLLERLKSPATYSESVIAACGLQDAALPAVSMSRLVDVSIPKNLATVVSFDVRRESPEQAKACAHAIFSLVQQQQAELVKPYVNEWERTLRDQQARLQVTQTSLSKAEKVGASPLVYLAQRDEALYLIEEIDVLRRNLARNSQTRLLAPIFASPQKVYPRTLVGLVGGGLTGAALGVLIVLGSRMRRMLRKGSI